MLRYAITNRITALGSSAPEKMLLSGVMSLLEDVRRWAFEGVEYVQLREPGLAEKELEALAIGVVQARNEGVTARSTPGPPTEILIHSLASVALSVEAEGIHLPGPWLAKAPGDSSESGGRLRAEVHRIQVLYARAGRPKPTISISCHTTGEVKVASGAGVTLILFGPVFGKTVNGQIVRPGVGLDILRQACELSLGAPVLALGGVAAGDADDCRRAGAAGLAGIRLFAGSSPSLQSR